MIHASQILPSLKTSNLLQRHFNGMWNGDWILPSRIMIECILRIPHSIFALMQIQRFTIKVQDSFVFYDSQFCWLPILWSSSLSMNQARNKFRLHNSKNPSKSSSQLSSFYRSIRNLQFIDLFLKNVEISSICKGRSLYRSARSSPR